MTWTKLADDFNDRSDLMNLSRSARLLYVEMYVFGNRLLLDGRIPSRQVRKFTDSDDSDTDLKELVAAGVVEVEDDELIIDWSDQELAVDVEERRNYRAEVQKKYRKRKDAHARGDHSLCDPRYCKDAVTGNATGSDTGYETPSRPVPSRPVRRTGDRDCGTAGSAEATPADREVKKPWVTIDCPHGIAGGAWFDGEQRCRTCTHIAFGARTVDGITTNDTLGVALNRCTNQLDVQPDEMDWFEAQAPESHYIAKALAYSLYHYAVDSGEIEHYLLRRRQLFRQMFTYLEPALGQRHIMRSANDDPDKCMHCDETADEHLPRREQEAGES